MQFQDSLQKSLLKYNGIVVIYFIFKLMLSNQVDNKVNIFLSIFVLCIFISDVLLYRSKYKGSVEALIKLHLLQFIPLLYGIYITASEPFNMLYFFLGLMILKVFILLPYNNKKLEHLATMSSFIAVSFSTLMITWLRQTVVDAFFSVIFTLLGLYFFITLFEGFKEELEMKLNLQMRLFDEVTNTNEELRKSQKKSKQNHEQLAKQKYDLEVANELLNKMTSEIYTQNELLRYLSSVLDINELLEVVNDAILGTIGVDTCSLVLYNEQNEEFLYNVKSNFPGNHLHKLIEKVESGALQKYFDTEKIHLNNRVVLSDYEFIIHRPVGSIAIIPLLRDHVTYGLIIAEHVNTDMFTENNLQFFTGISTQITIAINNANMYALMEEMAIKDGLTGIYNRKYLQDYLTSLMNPLNLKNQSGHPIAKEICAVLFDIDKFKTVNDRYGHLFGDEAIKMIASKASKYAKMYDGLAARYGGEEFVLIFPNISLEKGNAIIEQFHAEIIEDVLYCHEKEEVVKINISIGISHYPSIATSISDLLLRADNAMYYSKQNGRGRITLDKV